MSLTFDRFTIPIKYKAYCPFEVIKYDCIQLVDTIVLIYALIGPCLSHSGRHWNAFLLLCCCHIHALFSRTNALTVLSSETHMCHCHIKKIATHSSTPWALRNPCSPDLWSCDVTSKLLKRVTHSPSQSSDGSEDETSAVSSPLRNKLLGRALARLTKTIIHKWTKNLQVYLWTCVPTVYCTTLEFKPI